ncbi:MAG: ABC transporter substrate-binding protein [Oscillochloridaceae bacterium]|nr:ABC transporter substrate-binding protein [Chloroflexaceae bacterium]MDW8389110.1 ABC transporter substrate-binding protein [Oscillochloridaceae bacterium]
MSVHDADDRIIEAARRDVFAGRLSRREFMRLMSALGLSAGAAALAACGAAATPPPATAPPGGAPATAAPATSAPGGAAATLRVATEIPVQLDPALASSDAEILILHSIYDYLVDINARNEIVPRLAREWQVSDDGLTYTLRLVEGAAFHDGSPLTAADVVWTFNRLRDPSLQLPTADLYAGVAAVEADGDGTVVFTLSDPNPFFLYDLSDNRALVLKAETADAATSFNGTGPFKMVEYRPENRMTLAANENYFVSGKPGVANLELIFFADQAAAVDALRGGQVDIAMRMPTPLFETLRREPGLTAVQVPTNGFDLVRLRSDREPGNKLEVIQALKLATDRQAIFETVTLGLGAVGRDSPIGPLFAAYYSEETPIPPRDPARARDLLAQAGYANGLKLDLHVPDSGDRPDLAVVLKEQWAEAGIDVNVIVEPESVYYGENGWLEVDLGITGWGSRPVPQFYLDVMLVTGAKWNESRFSDAEFDALAAKAGSTLDEAERVAAYREIQRILIERGPIIVPYFFAALGAIRNGFEGFELRPFPGRTDLAAIRAAG